MRRTGQAEWCVVDNAGAAVQCFAVRYEAMGFARKKGFPLPTRRVKV